MMLNNMFSMFDPQNKKMNPFMLYNLIMMMIFKMNSKKKNTMNSNLEKMMFNMNKKNIQNKSIKSMNPLITKMSITIMIFNLMSMTPFSWCMTAQPSNNILMILMLMIPTILLTMKSYNKFLIHLTPMSTPNFLIPIMIIVETMSWMIRPLTLILRLTANIMSGHILLYLMTSKLYKMNNIKSIMITMMMMPMMLMESLISMIQAYIIMTLTTLYIKET